MFLLYQNNKIISEKYILERQIPKGLDIEVVKDDKIKKDSVIASGEMFEEKERVDIAGELEVDADESYKYLKCINGEGINKGDLIAIKKKSMLRKEKEVFARVSGVINLSEINSGILKIYDVAKETTINAGVEGKVIRVIKDKEIGILCRVLKIIPFKIFGNTISGELFFLDNDKEEEVLDSNNNIEIGSNLKGSIIALKFNSSFKFLRKLAIYGVKGIITAGISLQILDNIKKDGLWGMSIFVLNCYGISEFDSNMLKYIKINDGSLCIIDKKNKELILTNTPDKKESENIVSNSKTFLKNYDIGAKVFIINENYFGEYGVIEGMEQNNVKVKVNNGKIIEEVENNLILID